MSSLKTSLVFGALVLAGSAASASPWSLEASGGVQWFESGTPISGAAHVDEDVDAAAPVFGLALHFAPRSWLDFELGYSRSGWADQSLDWYPY